MNILLSNDDGIDAQGICTLAEVLSKEHNVLVSAPDNERSASGHAITIRHPIYYSQRERKGYKAYAVSGTPADCVKIGLSHLADFKVDLVITGINHGQNLGTDVFYSGTVSAAMEAVFSGYKAVALSYSGANDFNFKFAANFMLQNIEEFNNSKYKLHSVNFPVCPVEKIQGVKLTELGSLAYKDMYKPLDDGKNGYILTNPYTVFGCKNDDDCDIIWSAKGYVTVTPLMQDLTDFNALKNSDLKNLKV